MNKKQINKGILERQPLVLMAFAVFFLLLNFNQAIAQQELTSDELFLKARTEAFENKNYTEAIRLTQTAIEKTPDYTDLYVFLGRLYSWTDQPELARETFEKALIQDPDYEDTALAYGSLEYWEKNLEKALSIVNNGLEAHPSSEDLLILKSKILVGMKQYEKANEVLNEVLEINPESNEAIMIMRQSNFETSKNAVQATYDFVYFDERFDDPWQLASIGYRRQTKLGLVEARLNYANRFAMGSSQFEIDAYPIISKTFYAYINGGISSDKGIFPQYRAGFSLYANLPAAFEVDAGFRYLYFTDATWVYTIGLGKYYKNFWFNFRTFLNESSSGVVNSYLFTTRYYTGGFDDYLALQMGTGFSPDDATNNVLYNSAGLNSYNISLEYRKSFRKTNVFYIRGDFENIEYQEDNRGNQYTIGVGYIKRF
ncbi:YaiO family outer membrane beta-barrel protein [Galbibacter mesophilus]|uniref:YaiO family outer membrane beta-barrel protein n=1 Tax=Galbibacter mesophilus TaxID=379069 RepID=UPI001F5CA7FC|nr:YaiO family outer membrane beta-barrel protein [Galbibacter mesophilus]MCM5662709.1 YaiO family outer membrane beta-barrel protein [Galbibacter mesophilus]